jgi:hypothetical protein
MCSEIEPAVVFQPFAEHEHEYLPHGAPAHDEIEADRGLVVSKLAIN